MPDGPTTVILVLVALALLWAEFGPIGKGKP